MKFLRDTAFVVLSGICASQILPSLSGWPGFFAFVPLWYLWFRKPQIKYVLLTGFVMQYIMTLSVTYHLPEIAQRVFEVPPWVGFAYWLINSLVNGLYIPLAGIAALKIKKYRNLPNEALLVLFPTLTWLFEIFQPQTPPWHLGYVFWTAGLSLAQWADMFTYQGLGLLLLVLNALFVNCLVRPHKQSAGALVSFLVLLIILNFTGKLRKDYFLKNFHPQKQLSLLLIQPNIESITTYEKQYGKIEGHKKLIETLFEKTRAALTKYKDSKIDLILWPEAIYPAKFDNDFLDAPANERLRSFVRQIKIPLFLGAHSAELILGTRLSIPYNAVYLVDKDGFTAGKYKKMNLVPFAEKDPGIFPSFISKYIFFNPQRSGQRPELFSINNTRFMPGICYDDLHSRFLRQSRTLGADFILIASNDSWFGQTRVRHIHAEMVKALAVEARKTILRLTNTGISFIVSPTGDALDSLPTDEEVSKTVLLEL